MLRLLLNMPKLPRVTEQTDLQGKRVIVRASLNVPVKDGVVSNQFRIMRALPTINYLRHQGARVIIVAHIGRNPDETLEPVYNVLKDLLPITFSKQSTGELAATAVENLAEGEVLLLENIRSDEREKVDSDELATELAAFGELYVNDAFAASHRAHASLSALAKQLPACFGMNFIHEYEELSAVMNPNSPSLFILGGAKFDTKMPLVEEYIERYDKVLVAGALANDVFKARGYEVGTSLVSDVDLTGNALLANDKLIVPIDVMVKGPDGVRTCAPNEVTNTESILDAGPATIELLQAHIDSAATILWNGPLGDYEHGFATQTEALATAIAEAPGYAVLGGGDTIAAIEALCCQEKFGFLSTAGGAMLTFMETGSLPAIDAVINK